LLAFAVLAPGFVLCVLQYRSLVELEARARDSARERLHDVLSFSVRQAETRIQEVAGGALRPVAEPEPSARSELVARFASLRQAQAAIREIFLISQCACRGEPYAIFSSARETIIQQRLGHDKMHRILRALNGARPMDAELKYFTAAEEGGVIYAFRHLDPQHAVFAGVAIDAKKLFAEMRANGTNAEPIGLAVVDSERRAIWQSEYRPGQAEAEVRFGPPAADWSLQGRYTGATIQALAHRQFTRSLALMAVVVVCLMFGCLMAVRAAKREAQLAALRSAFIANVSHEMKTPLSLIRMFSETLELGRVSDQAKLAEYYQILHRESKKLTSLIENVLEFGRMEAGRREFHMSRANIAMVVEQVMASYEPQLRANGFAFATVIEPDLPLVDLDAGALAQAAGNVVDNAIKYSGETKAVMVEVFRQDSEIVIRVSDSGMGVPACERERIFDRFYRTSAPLVHNTKGSGLGLAIARHIVEAHGGAIRVESSPGKGSRFMISVPVGAPAPLEPVGADA
jgi:signal transduction histidine kinase